MSKYGAFLVCIFPYSGDIGTLEMGNMRTLVRNELISSCQMELDWKLKKGHTGH